MRMSLFKASAGQDILDRFTEYPTQDLKSRDIY